VAGKSDVVQVTRHTDLDAYLAAVAPMAARGEASASFFTGGAHSMKRLPPRPGERIYLATFRGAGTFGAALLRDVGPVLIGASDPAAAEAFAADLAGDGPELQGVMGAAAGCEAFARQWQASTGRASRLRVRMRQHALVAVNDVPAAAGAPRVASVADTEWVIERQSAFIEEVGIPPQRLREILPPRIARGDFRIWDDGRPVAYAGCNDSAPDFARIAPVYTLPGCRGRGYATALVAVLSRELLGRGKRRLFLTTDVANPTSNAIYARIGFCAENDDCGFDFIAAKG
jgi:predicted GNAT family acetyltransferase